MKKKLICVRTNPDGNPLVEYAPTYSEPPVATIWAKGHEGVRMGKMLVAMWNSLAKIEEEEI